MGRGLGSILFSASLGLLAYLAFGWVQGHHPLYEDLYGPVVFVATPILHGMAVGVLTQFWEPQTWRVAAKATWISVGVLLFVVLVTATEGIVCILMAAPLVLPLMFAGTWLGWRVRQGSRSVGMSLPAVGALALTIGGGSILPAPEADGNVTTSWWVAAPPQRVWPSVLSIDALPKPDWWLFRLGVAYPVRTRTNPDCSRVCLLSTGPVPEAVTVREEGRRLEFRVLSTPPSMKELNPFGEVHAPHLTQTFRSRTGGFLLIPERGGTRIVAHSTYGLRMGPAWYWKLWSDAIVRRVHERVIDEIRRRATQPEKRHPPTRGFVKKALTALAQKRGGGKGQNYILTGLFAAAKDFFDFRAKKPGSALTLRPLSGNNINRRGDTESAKSGGSEAEQSSQGSLKVA